jgi:GMP synthase-like glutamine amidotransferase
LAVTRALVVRHHDEDDAGLVGEALEAAGVTLETVMLTPSHQTPDVAGYDILVVLGSNDSVYDETAQQTWFNRELTMMGQAYMDGVAILGICFGAQALCVLAGGEVVKADRPEEGWVEIDVVEGCAISRGPWFEYHADRCVLPEDVEVLATSPDAVQAFTWGRCLGVQFHPEIDDVQLERWFASEGPAARAHSERESQLLEATRRETPAARERVAQLISFFLTHAGLASTDPT